MSIKIRPMTDLAKKMDEIEALCIEQSMPVYITKKGSERLVVLGHEYYENLVRELDELKEQNELYASLIQAAGESRRGEGKDFNKFIDELESELRETIADDQQCASKVSS